MKDWITKNLMTIDGRLCSKKCNREWFEKNDYLKEYDNIFEHTHFLNVYTPSFPQRLWHLYNDVLTSVKCKNPKCTNVTKFKTFTVGYSDNCSNRCAQLNPTTIVKIKKSNLIKYGTEYGLQSSIVKKKSIESVVLKYGVDNISKLDSIKDKKKDTCLKNHGVDYYLRKQDVKEDNVFKKYGVKNVQQSVNIKQKTVKTRRGDFYDSLFTTNRLKDLAIPLFNKDEYINNGLYKKYKFKCVKCDTEFLDCLEDGDLPRCTKCYKSNSYFQMEIYDYIKSLIDENLLILNCKTLISNREIDIYIPHLKLAIECDGLYWHGEVGGNKDKNYHLNKTKCCEDKGIHCIHIFEDEWMLKKDIVKSKIKNYLHKNSTVYARNCIIKQVNNTECQEFLTNNHIQGNDNSSIQYGLYYKDKLVMVATFGNLRVILGNNRINNVYELYRLCSSINITGGASKLIQHFIKIHKPNKIISYADRRYTNLHNSFYETIGFTKINNGTPNYWYFGKNANYIRRHRFAFAKHTLSKKLEKFDNNLSEWQNMKNNGYDRIWDCGSIKYQLNCE